jgi:uncharacterized protein
MGLREILIPADKKFYESFRDQAQNILLAAHKLNSAFNAQTLSVEEARKEIKQIEHNNDQIVHSIYSRLNKSFVTPIDSDDILKLSSDYDTIIDYIYATINRFYLYRIESPDEPMKKFATIVEKCAEELSKLTDQMEKKSGKVGDVSEQAIDTYENEADDILNEAVASLFERKLDPLDVIKIKEIYEFLEDTTDKFEDAGLLIRDIELRYA